MPVLTPTDTDHSNRSRPKRRRGELLLKLVVVVAAGSVLMTVLSVMGKNPIAEGSMDIAGRLLVDSAIRKQLSAEPDRSYETDMDHVRVLLCGTGTPEISAAKAQACTMVSAGGKLFLFDAGEGATKSLSESKVDITKLERVFLTHFHSDHFNGLATLVNEAWIWGRTQPLEVYGPTGVREVVGGLNAAYGLDNGYRAGHMPDLGAARDAAQAQPVQIDFADGARSTRVYDEGGVTIDAVLVDHEPVEPALGYVLTYRGKKVFISGDTQVVPSNLPWMQDADLVVHEAYATHLIRRALPIMRDLGQEHDADVAEHTIPYHADTIALAKQAQEAGVKHLALTHLTPYPRNLLARRLFVEGMDDHYDGKLTLGRDGMVIVV